MKTLFLLCILVLSISFNAQVEFCELEASIISRSMNKCSGCPGWLIAVNSDTIKVLSYPEVENSSRLYFPIKAKLTVGEKQDQRSIDYPYYDLLCIRVP